MALSPQPNFSEHDEATSSLGWNERFRPNAVVQHSRDAHDPFGEAVVYDVISSNSPDAWEEDGGLHSQLMSQDASRSQHGWYSSLADSTTSFNSKTRYSRICRVMGLLAVLCASAGTLELLDQVADEDESLKGLDCTGFRCPNSGYCLDAASLCPEGNPFTQPKSLYFTLGRCMQGCGAFLCPISGSCTSSPSRCSEGDPFSHSSSVYMLDAAQALKSLPASAVASGDFRGHAGHFVNRSGDGSVDVKQPGADDFRGRLAEVTNMRVPPALGPSTRSDSTHMLETGMWHRIHHPRPTRERHSYQGPPQQSEAWPQGSGPAEEGTAVQVPVAGQDGPAGTRGSNAGTDKKTER